MENRSMVAEIKGAVAQRFEHSAVTEAESIGAISHPINPCASADTERPGFNSPLRRMATVIACWVHRKVMVKDDIRLHIENFNHCELEEVNV